MVGLDAIRTVKKALRGIISDNKLAEATLVQSASMKTVIYVDPYSGGHRPDYLSFFRNVCAEIGVRFRAYVPQDVWDDSAPPPGCEDSFAEAISLDGNGIAAHWRLLGRLEKIAQQSDRALIFFSMADRFIPPLALRTLLLRPVRVKWSGIYFRDSFNYLRDEMKSATKLAKTFARASTLWLAGQTSSVPLVVFNEAWKLPLPKGVAFIPDALTELDKLARSASIEAAEWPLRLSPEKTDCRTRFLLFGSLAPRKGLVEFCEGLLTLDDAMLQKVHLRVMGLFYGPATYRQRFLESAMRLRVRGAIVDFIEEYAPWRQIDVALRWCDVSVGTYIDHLGQSGVLSTAVQYGRPVIMQANYQLGELVRWYHLGASVTPSDAEGVGRAALSVMTGQLQVSAGMAEYRERNSPERAGEAARSFLLQALGD